MFRKILVANRGAIARRVIRACRELGVASVAVHSEADREMPYLREADETWALPGEQAADTYLNQDLLLDALDRSGADALHPGYGFLAENAGFAARVNGAGAVFIGPTPDQIQRLGDKSRARELLAAQGFPVLPGSGLLADADAARQAAERLAYPLMLKPAGGGGGIGMQRITEAAALGPAFERAQQLAQAAFGDPRLYLEACWIEPRHIEVQLLGARSGGVMHAFERDCSLQRRHQKVIEEAPAPGVPRAEIEPWLGRAADALAALGYESVGTLEMLRSAEGRYGFLEMNTRIQVEHGVTELVTGLDLVHAQIQLAAGGPLPAPPVLQGHAMEARVLAVDTRTDFASTGRLSVFRPPRLRYVRVDTGYGEGCVVTPFYDALLAKVLAWGRTREQAIGRLLVGLRAFEVQGVATNLAQLQQLLQQPWFLSGQVHTEALT